MNRKLLVTLLGGTLLCSFGCQRQRYGFACDVLGTRESVSGEARADRAERIFDQSVWSSWTGPWVSVPDDAKTAGVLVMTHGYDIRVFPIATWTTKKGQPFYCTTPADKQIYGTYETPAEIRDSIAKKVGVEGAVTLTYRRRIRPEEMQRPAKSAGGGPSSSR